MCACDETGTCPRCKQDEALWWRNSFGTDERDENQMTIEEWAYDQPGVNRDPKESQR